MMINFAFWEEKIKNLKSKNNSSNITFDKKNLFKANRLIKHNFEVFKAEINSQENRAYIVLMPLNFSASESFFSPEELFIINSYG